MINPTSNYSTLLLDIILGSEFVTSKKQIVQDYFSLMNKHKEIAPFSMNNLH